MASEDAVIYDTPKMALTALENWPLADAGPVAHRTRGAATDTLWNSDPQD